MALDDYRGEAALLYCQEGLMCQPCWDQLTDIEARWADFQATGVDRIVSVTTDPLDALAEKVELEGISSPVLSDRDLAVSRQYDTNSYGMMGGSPNGHSFILVGPDGRIEWRADYGGEPDYTMYLPVENLLADLAPAGARSAVEVLLLIQDHCASCDDAKTVLERLAGEYPLSVATLDLASEEGRRLAARGGVLFPPGVFLGGEPFNYGRLSSASCAASSTAGYGPDR